MTEDEHIDDLIARADQAMKELRNEKEPSTEQITMVACSSMALSNLAIAKMMRADRNIPGWDG